IYSVSSHRRALHSFPTRRSSDLGGPTASCGGHTRHRGSGKQTAAIRGSCAPERGSKSSVPPSREWPKCPSVSGSRSPTSSWCARSEERRVGKECREGRVL